MEDNLKLRNSPDHHRVFWRLQRFGWVCMLLVVAAALAGLFANGPLAQTEAAGDGLRLRYARVGRTCSATTLAITVGPPHDTGRVSVRISRPYLRHFEIKDVLPEPVSVTASGDEIVYSFAAEPSMPLHVSMRLSADQGSFGRIAGQIRTSRARLDFWQFFWP